MVDYQVFYELTLKLLKLHSTKKVTMILKSFQNFTQWVLKESYESINSEAMHQLYKEIVAFFDKTYPRLRVSSGCFDALH
jgi:hypothetical protein